MSLSEFTFTSRVRPVVEIGVSQSRAQLGAAQWDTALWDNAAATWATGEPIWEDVTCNVRTAHLERGRSAVTDRFAPGVATLMVDNTSGWADVQPTPAPGPLQMRPGLEIRVGVFHEVYAMVWLFRGYIDAVTPVYAPGDNTVQIDCVDALGEVNRGKQSPQPAPIDATSRPP
jgi:hypothetical protein